MGLDITAVAKAKFEAGPQFNDGEAWDKGWRMVYVEDAFADRADGLARGYYSFALEPKHEFRAGSYSRYNDFRQNLCQAALGVSDRTVWDNYPEYAGRPFAELINFSDCEGVIGPRTSAKLYRDFCEHEPDVRAALGEWDRETYDDFKRAFEIAADDGLVIFH